LHDVMVHQLVSGCGYTVCPRKNGPLSIMVNSVVKISTISAKYFEYYTIILRGPFFRGHTVYPQPDTSW